MFWSDIDSWGKRKLRTMTLVCGIFYLIFATVIPVIIVANKYKLFTDATFKTSAVGVCVIVFILTAGIKACKWVVSILPEVKRSQQILKFSLEMIFELAVPGLILYGCHLIRSNIDVALFCIQYSCYSFFVAIFIENTCIKPLKVQWSCEAKVDENEKLAAIQSARTKA